LRVAIVELTTRQPKTLVASAGIFYLETKGNMNAKLGPIIDAARCDGCGHCVTHCAAGALGLANGKAVLVYPERCIYDTACEDACLVDAIALPYQVVFASPKAD
jgi:NAD-dependent dihydropyrimidine dehydrogenase PreA subunit